VFTVGAFARLAGVSARMLRAYDGAGLFRPAWTDPASAYRYYSPAQLPELRRILALRDLGMPLREIGQLAGAGADVRAALDRRREELERERAEVDRRLAALGIEVEFARGGSPAPDVVVRRIAAESVATFDVERYAGGDIGAAFYELEAHVRDTGRRAHRPPGAIADAAGGTTIFVPLTRPIQPTERIGVTRLPAIRAVTLLHRGPYASLAESRAALDRWSAEPGLHADGPLRILYLQFGAEPELRLPRGWVVERADDLVTELQLPLA
jgi:DNA-binding transcriptional MerR regulator